MAINWNKEIAKAERAMARNKSNIMNAPTSHGTAASWSNPKYDINRQVDDLGGMHEKDRKRQRKAVFNTIEKSRNIEKIINGEEIIKRPKRKRKRGQSKYKGRKPKGPFFTDPRTKEV